jgi:phytoene/squalene synthetase
MITELEDQLEDFSEVNRIRCFLHIVNLIAKRLLKLFDVSKRGESGDADDPELEKLLDELAKDFEVEETTTQDLDDAEDDELDDTDLGDDAELTDEQRAGIRPVTLVLAKVRASPSSRTIV